MNRHYQKLLHAFQGDTAKLLYIQMVPGHALNQREQFTSLRAC